MADMKRPFDALSSSSSEDPLTAGFGEELSTAATSAAATPVYSGNNGTHTNQPVKSLKLRHGQTATNAGSSDKSELDARRDAFL